MTLTEDEAEVLVPITYAAYHEAGHAVAYMLAWQREELRPPGPPVTYVEVTRGEAGGWDGYCKWTPVMYSTKWPAESRVSENMRERMEWEIISSFAGGLAEAIHRGERRYSQAVLCFAGGNCGMAGKWPDERGCGSDLDHAFAVLDDLHQVTRRCAKSRLARRTFTLMRKHWAAVEALAAELIRCGRIEGARAQEIFDQATPRRRRARLGKAQ